MSSKKEKQARSRPEEHAWWYKRSDPCFSIASDPFLTALQTPFALERNIDAYNKSRPGPEAWTIARQEADIEEGKVAFALWMEEREQKAFKRAERDAATDLEEVELAKREGAKDDESGGGAAFPSDAIDQESTKGDRQSPPPLRLPFRRPRAAAPPPLAFQGDCLELVDVTAAVLFSRNKASAPFLAHVGGPSCDQLLLSRLPPAKLKELLEALHTEQEKHRRIVAHTEDDEDDYTVAVDSNDDNGGGYGGGGGRRHVFRAPGGAIRQLARLAPTAGCSERLLVRAGNVVTLQELAEVVDDYPKWRREPKSAKAAELATVAAVAASPATANSAASAVARRLPAPPSPPPLRLVLRELGRLEFDEALAHVEPSPHTPGMAAMLDASGRLFYWSAGRGAAPYSIAPVGGAVNGGTSGGGGSGGRGGGGFVPLPLLRWMKPPETFPATGNALLQHLKNAGLHRWYDAAREAPPLTCCFGTHPMALWVAGRGAAYRVDLREPPRPDAVWAPALQPPPFARFSTATPPVAVHTVQQSRSDLYGVYLSVSTVRNSVNYRKRTGILAGQVLYMDTRFPREPVLAWDTPEVCPRLRLQIGLPVPGAAPEMVVAAGAGAGGSSCLEGDWRRGSGSLDMAGGPAGGGDSTLATAGRNVYIHVTARLNPTWTGWRLPAALSDASVSAAARRRPLTFAVPRAGADFAAGAGTAAIAAKPAGALLVPEHVEARRLGGTPLFLVQATSLGDVYAQRVLATTEELDRCESQGDGCSGDGGGGSSNSRDASGHINGRASINGGGKGKSSKESSGSSSSSGNGSDDNDYNSGGGKEKQHKSPSAGDSAGCAIGSRKTDTNSSHYEPPPGALVVARPVTASSIAWPVLAARYQPCLPVGACVLLPPGADVDSAFPAPATAFLRAQLPGVVPPSWEKRTWLKRRADEMNDVDLGMIRRVRREIHVTQVPPDELLSGPLQPREAHAAGKGRVGLGLTQQDVSKERRILRKHVTEVVRARAKEQVDAEEKAAQAAKEGTSARNDVAATNGAPSRASADPSVLHGRQSELLEFLRLPRTLAEVWSYCQVAFEVHVGLDDLSELLRSWAGKGVRWRRLRGPPPRAFGVSAAVPEVVVRPKVVRPKRQYIMVLRRAKPKAGTAEGANDDRGGGGGVVVDGDSGAGGGAVGLNGTGVGGGGTAGSDGLSGGDAGGGAVGVGRGMNVVDAAALVFCTDPAWGMGSTLPPLPLGQPPARALCHDIGDADVAWLRDAWVQDAGTPAAGAATGTAAEIAAAGAEAALMVAAGAPRVAQMAGAGAAAPAVNGGANATGSSRRLAAAAAPAALKGEEEDDNDYWPF